MIRSNITAELCPSTRSPGSNWPTTRLSNSFVNRGAGAARSVYTMLKRYASLSFSFSSLPPEEEEGEEEEGEEDGAHTTR